MSFETISPRPHLPHQQHHRVPTDEGMAALRAASASPFFGQSMTSPPLTPAAKQTPLQHIATSIQSPARATTRTPTPADLALPKMASTRGPAKPLTLQHQHQHYQHSSAQPSPLTPHFRSHHSPSSSLSHSVAQSHHHITSLPSPPLSSVEPPLDSSFFPKSPLQERCDALEQELSTLRLRIKRSEGGSARDKRLSFFHPTLDSYQSLQTVVLQFESTLAQLQDTERELGHVKSTLASKEERVRQLENKTHAQECELTMALSEQQTLSVQKEESQGEIAKFQRRLKSSTDKAEKLLQENRQLMSQVQELRAKASEVTSTTASSSSPSSSTTSLKITELEKDASKNKSEVDRLQDLVLMMSNRHVQLQAQLTFFQQQAQQLQHQLDLFREVSLPDFDGSKFDDKASSDNKTIATAKHGSCIMADDTLTSLLASVATVASTPHTRRTKQTRRYTVNAPRRDCELTMEQRKCEFLMEQISVLQRGYDALRQEKVTLELQLDLLQRQHQYHQQQRQKRRESQRRTLGQEQSATLSNALAIMVSANASSSAAAMTAIPSTPLLPTISAAEQEREKARIQHELELAQIRAQKEAEEKEAKRIAAKAAAEEAEREAIRLRRAKSIHLKETLASLEAKHNRATEGRTIQFSEGADDLKHLEHLRLLNDQPSSGDSMPSRKAGISFHSAAMARASRGFMSPLSLRHTPCSSPPPTPVSSTFAISPSPLLAFLTPSTSAPSSSSSAASSSAPSSKSSMSSTTSTSSSPPEKQPTAHYTPSQQHQQTSGSPSRTTYTYDIEQCSCCLGAMIEL